MSGQNRRRIIWQVLGLGGVLALAVVMLVLFVDVTAVWREIRQANTRYILAASVFLLAGLLLFAVRWRFLLQDKPMLLSTFHASNIGHAGNMLIPGRVGEPLRILVMGQDETVSYSESVSSFVVERLFEQMMRLLTLVLAIVLGSGVALPQGSLSGALILIIMILAVIILLVRQRSATLTRGTAVLARLPRVSAEDAETWLRDMLDNLAYMATVRHMGRALALSLLTWGFFWGFFYVTLLALDSGLPQPDLLAISIGALAMSPPSATTQPGLFHGSVVVPLVAVGFDEVILVAYAIILHIIEMFWVTLLALWALATTGISLSALINRRLPEA